MTRKLAWMCNAKALLGVSAIIMGCSDANFKASERRPPPPAPPASDVTTVELPCASDGTPVQTIDLTGSGRDRLVVNGEFCWQADPVAAVNQLTVLFAIDFSGSMGSNDPTVGGSCGRGLAMDAIVRRLRADSSAETSLRFGILRFDATAAVLRPLGTIQEFGEISPQSVCQAAGPTNYEAAFTASNNLLANQPGRKAIYFISDGLPTVSSAGQSQSDEKGLEASANLRRQVKDLALYAIYLDGPSPGVTGGQNSEVTDPRAYLTQITGHSANVRVVSSATDLAAEIVKFPVPDPEVKELSQLSGTLQSPGFADAAISFERFVRLPDRDNVWRFESQPIQLNQKSGETVSNSVKITVQDGNGETKVSSAIVNVSVRNE